MLMIVRILVICMALMSLPATAKPGDSGTAEETFSLAERLAVVINASDPQSRSVADYFMMKRHVPEENIIVVDFPLRGTKMNVNRFQEIYRQVQKETPAHAQFYVLAWSMPFRVGCMSITSAFTFGFDEKFCARGCKPTQENPYFNSDSREPFEDFGIRPSIMLAGSSVDHVRAMIDRGVRSDGTQPQGTAYLMNTSDKARNVRSLFYPSIIVALGERLPIQQVNADVLRDRQDVLFYFTGLEKVKHIDSNHFVDGAIADHLTSSGGRLFGSGQMSLLRWLEAGATASYGTVVEPCAFPQKFPHPGIVIQRYIQGETLIESYWKSVAWPGQGVFVGEPLAAPFAQSSLSVREQH